VHRIEAEQLIPGRGELACDGAALHTDPLADIADIAVLAWPAHVTWVGRVGRRAKS
jgi:hypothetical protein